MELVNSAQMKALDKAAIEKYGIPGIVLMENAGRATFEMMQDLLQDDLHHAFVVIIAGPGNNGGDGFVIARHLMNSGVDVCVIVFADQERIQGDALTNLKILEAMEADLIFVPKDETDLSEIAEIVSESDVVVDALFGTGLSSKLDRKFSQVIDIINSSESIVFSVDIPSGVDADTGAIMGSAVHADFTATYGYLKVGMVVYPGKEHCGFTKCIDISIPAMEIFQHKIDTFYFTGPNPESYFEKRVDPSAHKGSFGHVVVVGGSPGKTGAPVMAAQAASRIGAGLVTVAVPASLNSIFETKLTEEMTLPLPDAGKGFFTAEAAPQLLDFISNKSGIILGPGISTDPGCIEFVRSILTQYKGWIILDADALNIIAQDLSILKKTKAHLILTPHPGEMARLIRKKTADVQADRVKIARNFANKHKVTVVLKGAGTISAFPNSIVLVNSTGNPWMASGGQGDVLSGMIGGLAAQGIMFEYCVATGVYLHGFIADHIVEQRGAAPVMAGDVIQELPGCIDCALSGKQSHAEDDDHEHDVNCGCC